MTGKDLTPCDPAPYNPAGDAKAQDPRVMQRNAAQVERGFWRKLRRSVGRVPFVEEAVAAYFCAFDPQTPAHVRAALLAALAYFVLPFDAVPDFLAGIGFTDDATVLMATIAMVRAHISPAHRRAAKQALEVDG
jgi:uncharacterized membrane protein YkvA (DUF1232 family)